jgi:hypothetical protein
MGTETVVKVKIDVVEKLEVYPHAEDQPDQQAPH